MATDTKLIENVSINIKSDDDLQQIFKLWKKQSFGGHTQLMKIFVEVALDNISVYDIRQLNKLSGSVRKSIALIISLNMEKQGLELYNELKNMVFEMPGYYELAKYLQECGQENIDLGDTPEALR